MYQPRFENFGPACVNANTVRTQWLVMENNTRPCWCLALCSYALISFLQHVRIMFTALTPRLGAEDRSRVYSLQLCDHMGWMLVYSVFSVRQCWTLGRLVQHLYTLITQPCCITYKMILEVAGCCYITVHILAYVLCMLLEAFSRGQSPPFVLHVHVSHLFP